jgi:hypothetical protein
LEYSFHQQEQLIRPLVVSLRQYCVASVRQRQERVPQIHQEHDEERRQVRSLEAVRQRDALVVEQRPLGSSASQHQGYIQ